MSDDCSLQMISSYRAMLAFTERSIPMV